MEAAHTGMFQCTRTGQLQRRLASCILWHMADETCEVMPPFW